MLSFSIYSLIIYGILGAIIYHYIPQKYRGIFLSVFSMAVCTIWMRGAVVCLIFAMAVGIVTFKIIDAVNSPSGKRLALGVGILILIVNLMSHKVIYSYITGKGSLVCDDILQYIMPLGLSYYSFKIISFLIDSYKGRISNITNLEIINFNTLEEALLNPIKNDTKIMLKEALEGIVDNNFIVEFGKLMVGNKCNINKLF